MTRSWSAMGLVMLLGTLGFLNASGFCFSKFRYLTEMEFVELGVSGRARYIADFPDGESAGSKEAIRAFVKAHPGCCFISKDEALASGLFQNLIGFKSTWVRVAYTLQKAELDKAPKDGDFYEAFVEVTSCGTITRSIGQRLKEISAKPLRP